MRLILFFFLSSSAVHCDVIKDVLDYLDLEDPYELTTPPEKVEMTLGDLFVQYPSLRVTDEEELIELKKSFLEFINMNSEKRGELLSGTPSTKHKVLSEVLKGLTKIAKNEFKSLSKDEKSYCENVADLVWHKLSAEATMKVIKKKKKEYEMKKMTKEEIKIDVMMKGVLIMQSWHKGKSPDEVVAELEKITKSEL